MSRMWVYDITLGCWVDTTSGRLGRPSTGDWYFDAGEWRVWSR